MRVLKFIMFYLFICLFICPLAVECKTKHKHTSKKVNHVKASHRLSMAEVKEIVNKYTNKYDIQECTDSIVLVIRKESNGYADVISKNGKYYGMCQFIPRTFRVNVSKMVKAGLLDPDVTYSPLNPDHAVHVMVWMWSQGYHRQWGPARRMEIVIAKRHAGPA